MNVTVWGAFSDNVDATNRCRENKKFLPGIELPRDIVFTSDLKSAIVDKTIIVLAVPSQYLRSVLRRIKTHGFPKQAVFVSVVKGIEIKSLKRMSEVVHEELGPISLGVLSGPTIAHEVAKNLPTTAVAASHNQQIRELIQDTFMAEQFRVYTSDDVIGVELGGSLKNIIAIACGIADGLGFGTNTKAALLSRGLAEMARLGAALGAKAKTFSGLTGLGDLVTTCASPISRNRTVGEQIGKGRKISEIFKHMDMVAEGVPTAKSAYNLSKKLGVAMPITSEVYAVLYKNKSPRKAVKDLMTREKKDE